MVFKISNGTNIDLRNVNDAYGTGNDQIFVLAHNGQKILTYAGDDIVDASTASTSSFTMEATLGAGNDRFYGSVSKDWVYDGEGNDIVVLGAGDDRIFVDAGNDVYYGGSGTDAVDFRYIHVYGSNSTAEANLAPIKFDLALTGAQNLGEYGIDQFFGFENIFGGRANETFLGNAGANEISGNNGNDVIDGRAGADTLNAGDGSDVMIGGAGADIIDVSELIAARDIVRFTAITDSRTTVATADKVFSFDKGTLATDDRIDLSLIDSNGAVAGDVPFVFRGSGAFASAGGEVRLTVAGVDTIVHVDTDADAADEMIIIIAGVTGLLATDFIL